MKTTACFGFPHPPLGRREFLRAGLTGVASLTLPGLFRLRANAGPPSPRVRTAVIVVWLPGGPSHIETYDPKPNAPSEYRGLFGPIATKVPGLQICELLPRLAGLARRVAERVPTEAWRARLQGYAWAFTGNARRVQGNLPAADEAFLRAARLWPEGESAEPGPPLFR